MSAYSLYNELRGASQRQTDDDITAAPITGAIKLTLSPMSAPLQETTDIDDRLNIGETSCTFRGKILEN